MERLKQYIHYRQSSCVSVWEEKYDRLLKVLCDFVCALSTLVSTILIKSSLFEAGKESQQKCRLQVNRLISIRALSLRHGRIWQVTIAYSIKLKFKCV